MALMIPADQAEDVADAVIEFSDQQFLTILCATPLASVRLEAAGSLPAG